MKIQILGTGCAKCKTLEQNARAAAAELNLTCEFEKITDIQQIVAFGVMSTPALAVDGKVLSAGKLLSTAQIIEILSVK